MQKKKHKGLKILFIIIICIILLIAGYIIYAITGPENKTSSTISLGNSDTKTLVVYITKPDICEPTEYTDVDSHASIVFENDEYLGSVKNIATIIQSETGADIYEIKTAKYYRQSYVGTVARAFVEKTFSSRPDVVDLPENLDKYDTIYLCYPVWWFDVPMAVNTFLENYDFDGKTIIPVSSAIDNDITTTLDSVKNNAKNAKVTDGFTANNATKADIVSWLKK